MDYRLLDISRIAFDRVKPTRWKARYGGGGEILFQLPTFHATLAAHPNLPGSQQIRGTIDHHGFQEFEELLKKQTLECAVECATKEYKASFQSLTVFEGALVFDEHGGLHTGTQHGRYRMTPLVKVDGLWTSEYSWGYRVDVVQIKLHESLPWEEKLRVLVEGRPLMFLEDDDVDEKPDLFLKDDD